MTSVRFALAIVVLVAGFGVSSAFAKEGVKATLTSTIPLDAKPGERLRVSWTLSYVEAGKRHPFGASGVFVRLRSRSGAAPSVGVASADNGWYSATVVVPKGGIGDVQVGLRGEPSDALFPITNDPLPGSQHITPASGRRVPAEHSRPWIAPLLVLSVALG